MLRVGQALQRGRVEHADPPVLRARLRAARVQPPAAVVEPRERRALDVHRAEAGVVERDDGLERARRPRSARPRSGRSRRGRSGSGSRRRTSRRPAQRRRRARPVARPDARRGHGDHGLSTARKREPALVCGASAASLGEQLAQDTRGRRRRSRPGSAASGRQIDAAVAIVSFSAVNDSITTGPVVAGGAQRVAERRPVDVVGAGRAAVVGRGVDVRERGRRPA